MYKNNYFTKSLVFLWISILSFFSLVFGQSYHFDDETSQGWTWHRLPLSYTGVIFAWDDYVDYPAFPYDALGNNLGSISIQTPQEIVDSPAEIEFEFRSPDLTSSTEWQNAKGWKAQLLFLGEMWPGDPFPGAYVELTTGHDMLVDEPLDVWTGSGWQEIIVTFPDDLPAFQWVSLRFNFPDGLDGIYGGVFLDDVEPLAEIPQPISNLTVLNGYDGVPLSWNEPADNQLPKKSSGTKYPSEQKETQALTGYNVYRSITLNGSYSLIASDISTNYYRDQSTPTNQDYYYRVSAAYDEGESVLSDPIMGQSVSNGFYVTSPFTNTNPILDGVINQAEWSDAAVINIPYPGQSGSIKFYAMNNNSKLFMAVDDEIDQTLDDWDNFSLFIDANHDREWPSSTGSNEGMIRFYWDNASNSAQCTYIGFSGLWPDNLIYDDSVTPAGADQGISVSTDHLQYEISMDFNTPPLNASGGDMFGLLLFVYDIGSGQYDGLWPDESLNLSSVVDEYLWSYGPFAYGDLRLSTGGSDIDTRSIGSLSYKLYQNYPNPFNPKTAISYTIGTSQLKALNSVDLSIYNLIGQKVSTLVNKKQPTGTYEVHWDASGLPSGIYYYRLFVGNFIEVKKMILLK